MLEYNLTGDENKPCIVLIHGYMGSSQQWEGLLSLIPINYCVLNVGLPGHTATSEDIAAYSIIELAEELTLFCLRKNLSVEKIIGHSMGGYLATEFMKMKPSSSFELHLVNSYLQSDSEERLKLRDRAIKLLDRHPAAYVKMSIAHLYENTNLETVMKERLLEHALSLKPRNLQHAVQAMKSRRNLLDLELPNEVSLVYHYSLNDAVLNSDVITSEVRFNDAKSFSYQSGHLTHLIDYYRLYSNIFA